MRGGLNNPRTARGVSFVDTFVDAVARQKRNGGALHMDWQNAQESLLSLISAARALEEHGCCLPIQEAALLQDAAQRTWNATTEANWVTSETEMTNTGEGASPQPVAKTLYRLLAAHYYLLSCGFFASAKIRGEFLANHPDKAAKAVLMCLKTAKALAQSCKEMSLPNAAADSAELLQFASTIASTPVTSASVASARLAEMRFEVMLTSVSVLWDVGRWQEAVNEAAHFRRESVGSRTYQESFLQLAFTMANQHGGEAGGADGKRDASTDCPSASAAPDDPIGDATIQRERGLQALLAVSLDIQQADTQNHQKRRSLIGATLLQLASSEFRCNDLAGATRHTQAAYDELQSLEPLVLLVRIQAQQPGQLEAAFATFRQIVQVAFPHGTSAEASGEVLSVDEVLSLATVIVDADQAVLRTLGEVGGCVASCSESVVQYVLALFGTPDGSCQVSTPTICSLVSFLLHLNTEFSLGKMCTLMDTLLSPGWAERPRSSCTPETAALDAVSSNEAARFLFCACWCAGAADEDLTGEGASSHSLETRWLCLQKALGFARVAATAEEVESVLVKLAELSILQYQDDDTKTTSLQFCFQAMETATCDSLYIKLARCQVAFLLEGKQDAAFLGVQRLLEHSPDTTGVAYPKTAVVAAFGTLVNFLLSQNFPKEAGQVAGVLLSDAAQADSTVAVLGDAEQLAFLRVCLDGILAQGASGAPASPSTTDTPTVDPTVVGGLCQRSLDVLQRTVRFGVGETGVPTAPQHGKDEANVAADSASALEVSRWCRVLWYLSSAVIAPVDPACAVLIHSGAVDLFKLHACDYGDTVSKSMLVHSALRTICMEFDLFVCEAPVLPIETLRAHVDLVKECVNLPVSCCRPNNPVLDSRSGGEECDRCTPSPAGTIKLAEAEIWLRSLVTRHQRMHPLPSGTNGVPARENSGVRVPNGVADDAPAGAPCNERSVENLDASLTESTPGLSQLDPAALVAVGVPAEELDALALAVGSVADLLGGEPNLAGAAVALELAALAAARRHVQEDHAARETWPKRAAVMLFRADQLTGSRPDLQKRVCEAALELLQDDFSPSSSAPRGAAASTSQLPNPEVSTAAACPSAFVTCDDVEAVYEYLAVEAWNRAVNLNATRERQSSAVWRRLALSLCLALPTGNRARLAIPDYADRMPVL